MVWVAYQQTTGSKNMLHHQIFLFLISDLWADPADDDPPSQSSLNLYPFSVTCRISLVFGWGSCLWIRPPLLPLAFIMMARHHDRRRWPGTPPPGPGRPPPAAAAPGGPPHCVIHKKKWIKT
jgi:hypothetical protein